VTRRSRKPGGAKRQADRVLLYGRHAVAAALANPRRRAYRLLASRAGRDALAAETALPASLPVETLDARALARAAPEGAVTQGLLLEAAPLPAASLEAAGLDRPGPALALMLDQVEDPRNVGAILRSAAAFGARALITQDRHSPAESGPLAKAASGALDSLVWVRVTNLTDALGRLARLDYWRIGLESEAETPLGAVDLGSRLVIVLGAEGRGLRPRVSGACDLLARIPLQPASPTIDSLNVSAAAAVALYAASQARDA